MTEEEIYNGILKASSPDTSCHWFKREIVDLRSNSDSKLARRFMDISKGIDTEAQDLLDNLK